jgi:hypothetical protein
VSKLETGELLALACKALTERYRSDPWRPGIQIAHIPALTAWEGGPTMPAKWYLAAHRYTGSFGASRIVLHKSHCEDLDGGLIALASHIAPPPETAQRDLARALKGLV